MKTETTSESAHEQENPGTLRNWSVKAAGVGTLIADGALITRGFSSGEHKIGMAGLFGIGAGTVGAVWGNPKTEKQLELIYRKLGSYLRKEGVEIPDNPTPHSLNKEGGLLSHIDTFLSSYPTQVMNIFYGLIGASFTLDGKQSKSNFMMASGALLITGALAGILIEEKKPDPKHAPHGVLEKGWSWIQEKPLRLTGTLFNANQVLLALSARDEWKKNPADKKYLYKVVAVAGFVFGNIMLALSSTSHGGSKMNDEALNELATVSARVIAAQPPEVQRALLEHISGFLASQPNVNMKAEAISDILHKKMSEVAQRPAQAGWVGRTGVASDAQAQPSL